MHTILVADDSVTILKAVEIVFDKEPFQVVKAGSAAEAIARARELLPALVLADHTLGDKTGYDIAEALRADPSTSGIPVLLLSAASAPYDEGRAKAAGVVGHVPKPFDCQTLLDRVRNLLGVPATAPGTFVSTQPAASTGATAHMPRPPGVPGSGGMPRPPGLPRAPVTAPIVSTSPQPVGATPMNRAPTPQPARNDLDPFGFGATLNTSTPPLAASSATASSASPSSAGPSSSTPPRTASQSVNPFATSSSIGGALGTASVSSSPPMSSPPMSSPPMTSPPSISGPLSGLSAQEPWKTTRTSDAFDIDNKAPPPRAASTSSASASSASAVSALPSAAAAHSSTHTSPATTIGGAAASMSPSALGKTQPPAFAEAEFLEVADIEVTDIPSTPSLPPQQAARPSTSPTSPTSSTSSASPGDDDPSRRTDKLDLSQLRRLDEQTRRPVTMEPVAAAVDLVTEKAATVIAKAGGAQPSREALTEEARQIVERIAWEVVPELAEVIIREEIQRLLKSKA